MKTTKTIKECGYDDILKYCRMYRTVSGKCLEGCPFKVNGMCGVRCDYNLGENSHLTYEEWVKMNQVSEDYWNKQIEGEYTQQDLMHEMEPPKE